LSYGDHSDVRFTLESGLGSAIELTKVAPFEKLSKSKEIKSGSQNGVLLIEGTELNLALEDCKRRQ
jgi:hypothetical protein